MISVGVLILSGYLPRVVLQVISSLKSITPPEEHKVIKYIQAISAVFLVATLWADDQSLQISPQALSHTDSSTYLNL